MFELLKDTKTKILVIGDLMIDEYIWGDSNRISPEAPVQIVNVKSKSHLLGGAGNVVNNLKSLGANVSILSVIGDCENSDQLIKLFHSINVETKYLLKENDRITSKKTRIISSHQQVIRYDQESTHSVSKKTEEIFLLTYKNILRDFDLVVLSDYGKGLLSEEITCQIIDLANKEKLRVIVDPKGINYSKYKNAYLLTPNRKEASEATNISIVDEISLDKAIKKLKKDLNLSVSLITLSEDGIAVFDTKLRTHPTRAKEVFDVTGAGDTVIAALAIALANSMDIDNAVKLANLAAGIVVSKIGSSTTTIEEMSHYESNNNFCESKVISSINIEKILSDLKRKRKKIVFTNGCFDILHVGHVSYLMKARNLGDILIIGLNSDSSVKRLKGPDRPINPLNDRACILSSLSFVDYVISFDEDTPLELIKRIKPDILVKGADYQSKDIAGKDFVDEVRLIEFIKGKSTSQIIQKIQNL